jgi:hypothetical protein
LSAELSRNKPLEAGSAPGRSPWNGLSRRDQAPIENTLRETGGPFRYWQDHLYRKLKKYAKSCPADRPQPREELNR